LSEIRATTISDAAGTGPITLTKQSAAKAWVNWNGTGTVAIRDSFNVGSITDNGTGDYTTNISSAMANANYSYVALGGDTSASLSVRIENASNRTTTTIDLLAYNTSSAQLDMADLNGLFHGDLA
jgi:hypothetical protein